jgi:glutamate-1-semialdehyde 2,1-aminomutase
MSRELETFEAAHPRSKQVHERAGEALLYGVPMNWMTRWPGSFPVFFEEAKGNRLRDVDGNELIDFCLGDTGAMTGHSPYPRRAGCVAGSRRCCRARTRCPWGSR